jgi:hypothetical protein
VGLAPLAIVEFFCASPSARQLMERNAREFLRKGADIEVADANARDVVMKLMLEDDSQPLVSQSARLRGSFLSVNPASCYGDLHIFDAAMGHPGNGDWQSACRLCDEIINRELCSSVYLNHGCESKGLFGTRYSSAVVASPDFAMLSVLRHLGLFVEAGLPSTVPQLSLASPKQRFCQREWRVLRAKCISDVRFSPVLAR